MFKAKAAYGRTYASQVDAMRDWENGKDFQLQDGRYFSVRDFALLKRAALTDRALYNEDYVLEIRFVSTTKHAYDTFYVNFNGTCVLAT